MMKKTFIIRYYPAIIMANSTLKIFRQCPFTMVYGLSTMDLILFPSASYQIQMALCLLFLSGQNPYALGLAGN